MAQMPQIDAPLNPGWDLRQPTRAVRQMERVMTSRTKKLLQGPPYFKLVHPPDSCFFACCSCRIVFNFVVQTSPICWLTYPLSPSVIEVGAQ